jgi:hypothetical protein
MDYSINYDSDLINDSFTQQFSSLRPSQFSQNSGNRPDNFFSETHDFPSTQEFSQILSSYGSRQQSYLENKNFNYEEIFDKIREKIYFKQSKMEPMQLMQIEQNSQIEQSEEFNILKNVKDKISKLYIKKIEIDEKINLAKKNNLLFTDTINNTINFFNEIEYDPNLKDLLNKKVDLYFLNNNIENLMNESLIIDKELEDTKSLITLFSSFLPSVSCSICFDKQVEYFMDPCGHSVCKDCKIKCEVSNKCHYCRTVRKKFNKLYLS